MTYNPLALLLSLAQGQEQDRKPTVETIADPNTGEEFRFAKIPGDVKEAVTSRPLSKNGDWVPPPAVERETPKKIAIEYDNDALEQAKSKDRKAEKLIGFGELMDRHAQSLAGYKSPDLSYHESQRKQHAGNAASVTKQRDQARLEAIAGAKFNDDFRKNEAHEAKMAKFSSNSQEARALQKFFVDNDIITPEHAVNMSPEMLEQAVSGLKGLWQQQKSNDPFERWLKLKAVQQRDQDLEFKRIFAHAMEGFRDVNALRQAEVMSGRMVGGGEWITEPNRIISQKDKDTFAHTATIHGVVSDAVRSIEDLYKANGPEWFFGQGRGEIQSRMAQLRAQINVALGQAAMSHGDMDNIKQAVPDQDTFIRAFEANDANTFLSALKQVKAHSMSTLLRTAQMRGFLHISDPRAKGLQSVNLNTSMGPIKTGLTTQGGAVQPMDPSGGTLPGAQYRGSTSYSSEPMPQAAQAAPQQARPQIPEGPQFKPPRPDGKIAVKVGGKAGWVEPSQFNPKVMERL